MSFRLFFFTVFIFIFLPITGWGQIQVSLNGYQGSAGTQIMVEIQLDNVETTGDFNSFQFRVVTVEPQIEFVGVDKTGTLSASQGWTVGFSASTNLVGAFASSLDSIGSSGVLIKIILDIGAITGNELLQLTEFKLTSPSGNRPQTPANPSATIVSSANNPPSAPSILTPLANATVAAAGDPNTLISFTWTSSIDPDNDGIVYTWDVSSNVSMDPIIWTQSTASTGVTKTVAQAAALLDQALIPVGGQLTLFHRVVANDGTVDVPGPVVSFELMRGLITSVDESADLPSSFQIESVYPNPSTNQISVRFAAPTAGPLVMSAYDALGRNMRSEFLARIEAGRHEIDFELNDVPAGVYYLKLQIGESVKTSSFIVAR